MKNTMITKGLICIILQSSSLKFANALHLAIKFVICVYRSEHIPYLDWHLDVVVRLLLRPIEINLKINKKIN